MARTNKKQKIFIIKNMMTLDFFKGFYKDKGYTMWTYNMDNAMRFDSENDANLMSDKINEETEVVIEYVA